MGQAAVRELLISNGADPKQKNDDVETRLFATMTDTGTNQTLAGLLKLDYYLPKVQAGRAKCVELPKNGIGDLSIPFG